MAEKKKSTTTAKKPITKKPGYIKKSNNIGYDRWDGDSLGVCAIKDIKPIKRGK